VLGEEAHGWTQRRRHRCEQSAAAAEPAPKLLSRVPLVAAKAGASDSFARLLERIERQLRELLERHVSRERELQRQGGEQAQAAQAQAQPQRDGGRDVRAQRDSQPPQPGGAPDAKRQKLAAGGSGSAGSGGGGGWLGGGGASSASGGGSGERDSASPEQLVQSLLQRYAQAEDKAAVAAAEGGSGGALGPRQQLPVWRAAFVTMLRRVPVLHPPLLAALAAAAEGGGAPGPAGAAAARRCAIAARLLASMAACRAAQEAVAGGAAGASQGGATARHGRPEVELAPCTRPCHAWSVPAPEPGSCSGSGGGGGSTYSGDEGLLQRLGAAQWPEGFKGPAVAGTKGGTQAAAVAACSSGGSGVEALCAAFTARCRLGTPAQLAGAAAFWAAYLEQAAAAGWWCTAGEGSGVGHRAPRREGGTSEQRRVSQGPTALSRCWPSAAAGPCRMHGAFIPVPRRPPRTRPRRRAVARPASGRASRRRRPRAAAAARRVRGVPAAAAAAAAALAGAAPRGAARCCGRRDFAGSCGCAGGEPRLARAARGCTRAAASDVGRGHWLRFA
jgi:hypothetical protein